MYACACLRDEGHNLLAGRSARIPFKSSQTAPKPGPMHVTVPMYKKKRAMQPRNR